jgi:small subunit ribosomal protein S21
LENAIFGILSRKGDIGNRKYLTKSILHIFMPIGHCFCFCQNEITADFSKLPIDDPMATYYADSPSRNGKALNPNRESIMPEVTVRKGEPIDRALKRLKNKLDSEGILDEVRRLRAFETPTQKSRRKARINAKRGKQKFRFNAA